MCKGQGARVIPMFKRMGADFEHLQEIKGLEDKVKHLIKKGRSQADAILFELLTALCWSKNGWEVSFIPENPPLKTPDLLAVRDEERYYIECKRLRKSSDFSEHERENG